MQVTGSRTAAVREFLASIVVGMGERFAAALVITGFGAITATTIRCFQIFDTLSVFEGLAFFNKKSAICHF
jgi:hypothetical protein